MPRSSGDEEDVATGLGVHARRNFDLLDIRNATHAAAIDPGHYKLRPSVNVRGKQDTPPIGSEFRRGDDRRNRIDESLTTAGIRRVDPDLRIATGESHKSEQFPVGRYRGLTATRTIAR